MYVVNVAILYRSHGKYIYMKQPDMYMYLVLRLVRQNKAYIFILIVPDLNLSLFSIFIIIHLQYHEAKCSKPISDI